MAVNWQVVGHATVGITIGVSQAVAMAFPTNAEVVAGCHIAALLAAQIGASLGVWTVSQAMGMKRTMALTPCGNCGKLPETAPPAPEKEATKAA